MFQLSDSKLAFMFQGYHEINGIGKFTCQNLCFFSFFFFFFSLLACRTRRSRIGAVSGPRRSRVGESGKKKKKRHCRTPESCASYPFRCPTRVGHGHDAKNGVSVQPSSFPNCGCASAMQIHFLRLPVAAARCKGLFPSLFVILRTSSIEPC